MSKGSKLHPLETVLKELRYLVKSLGMELDVAPTDRKAHQDLLRRINQVSATALQILDEDWFLTVNFTEKETQKLNKEELEFLESTEWLVASGHKMCAPTGIGFLYGKLNLLRSMPPFLGGGEMIADVFLDHATYADLPHKFEAGTPAIAEAIALGAAVDYLSNIGMDKIYTYEAELTGYLFEQLAQIPEIRTYGPLPKVAGLGRAALASFTAGDVHPHDLSTILDQAGVAIRAGHHCTQPLHRYLVAQSTARASLSFYNTRQEIDVFITTLKEAVEFFGSIFG